MEVQAKRAEVTQSRVAAQKKSGHYLRTSTEKARVIVGIARRPRSRLAMHAHAEYSTVPRLVEHRRRRKVGVQRDLDALRGSQRGQTRDSDADDKQQRRSARW